ncbi:MAG: hypothetical protein AB1815_05130 [Bacillota bacterium]|jgi:hypothetical protein
MELYWDYFFYGMAILGAAGILAAIITNPVKEQMAKVEKLADGRITQHHRYIPYD